jgi:prefoldin subunit 5
VHAQLNCHDVVLVEIGTGYFVEMVSTFVSNSDVCNVVQKHDKAIAYYQRKYDFLAKQIDQVAQVLGEKQNAKTGRFAVLGHIYCRTRLQQLRRRSV